MPSSHTLVDVVVWICWGAFAIVWVGGALYNARRSPHVRRRSLRSSAWLLLAIAIWLVARRVVGVDRLSYQGEADAVRGLGAALLVVATGFAIWARVELGTMWSSTPVTRENHVLRTDRPYAVTRHPIYTGILGMMLGSAVALGFGAWLYVFVLVFVFIELRIRSGEAPERGLPRRLRRVPPACSAADSRSPAPQFFGILIRPRCAPPSTPLSREARATAVATSPRPLLTAQSLPTTTLDEVTPTTWTERFGEEPPGPRVWERDPLEA